MGFDDGGDEDLEEEGDNGVAGVSCGKGEWDSVYEIRWSLDLGNIGGRDDCGGELSEVWLKKGNAFSWKITSRQVKNCWVVRS